LLRKRKKTTHLGSTKNAAAADPLAPSGSERNQPPPTGGPLGPKVAFAAGGMHQVGKPKNASSFGEGFHRFIVTDSFLAGIYF